MSEIPVELRRRLDMPFDRSGMTWYYPSTWSRHLDGLNVMDSVTVRTRTYVTRGDLCLYVGEHLEASPIDAFLRVMQWGYGPQARGASRAAQILGSELEPSQRQSRIGAVSRALSESARTALSAGPVAAYEALTIGGANKIEGFGSAFFTKWIYAVTARGDAASAQAAPILDSVVASWLNAHAGTDLLRENSGSYEAYVDLLGVWSGSLTGESRRTIAQLEHEIFALSREGCPCARCAEGREQKQAQRAARRRNKEISE